jgi:RHH-type transcriptional regulator, proline utilization regulon repressor / proline dehydrogenase / delta 1-pyrroline-5-carboxylate dehydrogenase
MTAPTPFGTVLVTPPWNFPYAIPCGGVLAALAAGNTVILKPAPETVLTGWMMVPLLVARRHPARGAPVPPCPDNDIGRALVTDPHRRAWCSPAPTKRPACSSWKPELRLFAETSGKNALIITAAADPDQAVKDLGEKRLRPFRAEMLCRLAGHRRGRGLRQPGFRRQLRDAAASLKVGTSWNSTASSPPASVSRARPDTRPHPTRPRRGVAAGTEDDRWQPCLWSPGIRLGVRPTVGIAAPNASARCSD